MSDYSGSREGEFRYESYEKMGCFPSCMRSPETTSDSPREIYSSSPEQHRHSRNSQRENNNSRGSPQQTKDASSTGGGVGGKDRERDSLNVAQNTIDALKVQRRVVCTEIAKQESELESIRVNVVKLQERERVVAVALEKNKQTHENYGHIIAENAMAVDKLRKAAVSIKSTMGSILREAQKDLAQYLTDSGMGAAAQEDAQDQGQGQGQGQGSGATRSQSGRGRGGASSSGAASGAGAAAGHSNAHANARAHSHSRRSVSGRAGRSDGREEEEGNEGADEGRGSGYDSPSSVESRHTNRSRASVSVFGPGKGVFGSGKKTQSHYASPPRRQSSSSSDKKKRPSSGH